MWERARRFVPRGDQRRPEEAGWGQRTLGEAGWGQMKLREAGWDQTSPSEIPSLLSGTPSMIRTNPGISECIGCCQNGLRYLDFSLRLFFFPSFSLTPSSLFLSLPNISLSLFFSHAFTYSFSSNHCVCVCLVLQVSVYMYTILALSSEHSNWIPYLQRIMQSSTEKEAIFLVPHNEIIKGRSVVLLLWWCAYKVHDHAWPRNAVHSSVWRVLQTAYRS